MKFSIPTNLDLEALLNQQESWPMNKRVMVSGKKLEYTKETPTKTKNLLKYIERCYYIVNQIIVKNEKKKTNNWWVNLNRETLEGVLAKAGCTYAFEILNQFEVIETNNRDGCKYKAGEFSKSYRLSEKFANQCLVKVKVSKKLSDRIRNRFENKDKTTKNWLSLPCYKFQEEQFTKLNFDIEGAIKFAKSEQNDAVMTKIEDWEYARIYSIDLRGRVYSWVAALVKEYRCFITDNNGSSLIYVDFRSSQTLHLLNLINEELTTSSNEGLKSEFAKLIDAVSGEGIYELVVKKFGNKKDRDWIKEAWSKGFLSTHRKYENIRNFFPSITKFIDDYPRKDIWEYLHRREAELTHKKIVGRIAKDVNTATIFAIHDGILVDQSHFDEVLKIVLEESRGFFHWLGNIDPLNLITVKKLIKPLIEETRTDEFRKVPQNNSFLAIQKSTLQTQYL